jgi:hypothetical protein
MFILNNSYTRYIFYKQKLFKLIKLLNNKEINTITSIKGHSLKLYRKKTIVLLILIIRRDIS